ncbi:hypothetical protein AUJ29_01730 [Candidatus Kuenenbacteria bacterium CG1_02_38_13]|uniref:Uncharacterized protein n=1 Tax=Candidatus Kuenenbacteria bacterium CG1_02_38_13 TaxID=1805235 RepID=A0A1J4U1L3_9BACT|nr:MAG: hypothetical protein AUJ29_01730 [Candidatus Kuenenbacteria bacterium CG1_02_38_13]
MKLPNLKQQQAGNFSTISDYKIRKNKYEFLVHNKKTHSSPCSNGRIYRFGFSFDMPPNWIGCCIFRNDIN